MTACAPPGPAIYAAGDVTGRDQFVYMAAYGAKLAAKNALNGDSLRYDNSAMPAIVFTDPQVASVGLTEGRGRARPGMPVRVSTIGLNQVPRAPRRSRHPRTRSSSWLTPAAAGCSARISSRRKEPTASRPRRAIRQSLTVEDLADTIFPYLTTIEGLKLAALSFGKDVARSYPVALGELGPLSDPQICLTRRHPAAVRIFSGKRRRKSD